MNKDQIQFTKEFIIAVLKDDNGISENAFMRLNELVNFLGERELYDIMNKVDATDGHFYLPEE